MHEPPPRRAANQIGVTHRYFRDIETRSQADLRKLGAHRYAADPSTEFLLMAFAVDRGPTQLCFRGDPPPPEWIEAAVNPSWEVVAHGDHFESAIEQHVLHARHGWPIVPLERHVCTQARCSGTRAAGKAGHRGRRIGAGKPQRRCRRTADAPDVEAAKAA